MIEVCSPADVAEDPEPPQRRYNTAEMADAVMGTAHSPAGIQQLIPRELQESVLGEPCAEEDQPEEARDTGETHSQNQSQNFTEAAKTYKVTCDLRNTSGIQRFAVQVLNASQVRLTRVSGASHTRHRCVTHASQVLNASQVRHSRHNKKH